MPRKLVSFLIIACVVGGIFALIATGQIAKAGFFDDLFSKLFPTGQPSPAKENNNSEQKPEVPLYKPAIDYENAVVNAVEKASPSVVSIVVTKDLPVIENCPYSPFENMPPEFRQFFGQDFGFQFQQPCQKGTKKQEVGGGTGFIISEDGMILTNKHVVYDTKADYTVLTNDGKKYDAKVLARDPVQDLAIIKITAPGLKAATLGDSDSIKLGQTAIVIGNALGEYRNTVSVGVISGLARTVTASGAGVGSETITGVIQTDAAINPGNSGGPLLNLKGEVIGINTAMASGAENIGFAIPINNAKRDINSVKKSGDIKTAYLGVRYILINEDVAKKQKLSVDYGALVRGTDDGPGVIPNSPAAKAGIQAEDILLEVNGKKIEGDVSLSSLIQKYEVGDTISLKVRRGDATFALSVVLEERPKE